MAISIHPPLAGRDSSKDDADTVMRISIHPPLAGRDTAFLRDTLSRAISIHPPLAGRDIQFLDDFRRAKFQSTRPLRGGTLTYAPSGKRAAISIHPPLAGRDLQSAPPRGILSAFQSTRPLRGGTAILHKKTVQNIAYCTKSAFTLAVLSGFLALMRPFFLPNVHKFRCEPSEESLLAPRSHAYTIRTPSG